MRCFATCVSIADGEPGRLLVAKRRRRWKREWHGRMSRPVCGGTWRVRSSMVGWDVELVVLRGLSEMF